MMRQVSHVWNFFAKIFCKTVARLSYDIPASVANLSPQNFGEFTIQNFRDTRTNVVRKSYDGHATVLRKHANTSRLSGEKIKLSDICTNVMRHSHKCRATVLRMKIKISRKVVRLSRDSRDRNSRLSHKCPFNETAT